MIAALMRKRALASAAAAAVLVVAAESVETMTLPGAECPVVETVSEAKSLCTGDFSFWGDYEAGSSAFGAGLDADDKRGPYQCSTCGIGYVCAGASCPTEVYVQSGYGIQGPPFCPRLDPERSIAQMTPSCADLQRHCVEAGAGWLMQATAYPYEERFGFYVCAGCVSERVALVGTVNEEETRLDKPQMIALYIIIIFFLIVSAVVDYRVFKYGTIDFRKTEGTALAHDAQTTSAWRTRYILYLLGYIRENGEPRRICCNTCNCKRSFRSHAAGLWDVLSVAILSFGVSCLFQPDTHGTYSCYFDGFATAGASATSASELFGPAFAAFFGYDTQVEGFELSDPTIGSPTSPDFIISELVVLAFQLSSGIFRQALFDGGYASKATSRAIMLAFAAGFTAVTVALDWTAADLQALFYVWLIGFIILVIFIGPIASTITWILGRILAAILGYKPPALLGQQVVYMLYEAPEPERSTQENQENSSGVKPDHDDVVDADQSENAAS